MTRINLTAWSNNDDRKVAIQVTGLPNQSVIIVPYYRLSQTIKRIARAGGRIRGVTVQSSALIDKNLIASASVDSVEVKTDKAAESAIIEPPPSVETVVSEPSVEPERTEIQLVTSEVPESKLVVQQNLEEVSAVTSEVPISTETPESESVAQQDLEEVSAITSESVVSEVTEPETEETQPISPEAPESELVAQQDLEEVPAVTSKTTETIEFEEQKQPTAALNKPKSSPFVIAQTDKSAKKTLKSRERKPRSTGHTKANKTAKTIQEKSKKSRQKFKILPLVGIVIIASLGFISVVKKLV